MNLEQNQKGGIKLKYAQCNKPGLLHENEPCNTLCLEEGCINNALCCCICAQQFHSKHRTTLLKSFLNQAQEQSKQFQPSKYNSDVIFDIISSRKKELLQDFYCQRKSLMALFDKIQNSIMDFFKHTIQQFSKSKTDLKDQINKSISILSEGKSFQSCQMEVKKLTDLIYCLRVQKFYENFSETDIIENLESSVENIKRIIIQNFENVKTQLTETCSTLHLQIQNSNVFSIKENYEFSEQLKHPAIQIQHKHTAKSVISPCYKLALLLPSIEAGLCNKTIQFTIEQCTLGWVALGICHRKIVLGNNFTINPNDLGHGAYFISSNGGVWSNHMHEFNNKIKSFKFGKGDKVKLKVCLHDKMIIFTKNLQRFQLPLQLIKDDQLYPCAIFYNINDKVICSSNKPTPFQ